MDLRKKQWSATPLMPKVLLTEPTCRLQGHGVRFAQVLGCVFYWGRVGWISGTGTKFQQEQQAPTKYLPAIDGANITLAANITAAAPHISMPSS